MVPKFKLIQIFLSISNQPNRGYWNSPKNKQIKLNPKKKKRETKIDKIYREIQITLG